VSGQVIGIIFGAVATAPLVAEWGSKLQNGSAHLSRFAPLNGEQTCRRLFDRIGCVFRCALFLQASSSNTGACITGRLAALLRPSGGDPQIQRLAGLTETVPRNPESPQRSELVVRTGAA